MKVEHKPPKFTTGMKTCFVALLKEAYANLYWLILALVLALMLWLAPKVNATPLTDFLTEHKLEFPRVVMEQAEKQDLVAAAGTMDEKEKIFTVYFLRKTDLPTSEIQTIDFSKAVMECKFFLLKKKITVEYECWRNNWSAKIWPSYRLEYRRIFLTLFPL